MKRILILLWCLAPLLQACNAKPIQETGILVGAQRFDNYVNMLAGKNVAIVANDASRIGGTHLIDSLQSLNSKFGYGFNIHTVFSPEHGFSLKFDAGKEIDTEEHGTTEFKLVSLYGKKKKPSVTDLKGVDIVLFDLQDVGVRFYTYLSTLHYVMEACAENKIPMIVMDRPNPHCTYTAGPIMEEKYMSFVGMHPVPVVYGMTIGEYAKMINGEKWLKNGIQCNLTVVELGNYRRGDTFHFIKKPSPNLPNMDAVGLYPSLCFFEGTVVSAGRGTNFPFQVYGHPEYPKDSGFRYMPVPIQGVSVNPKFKNQLCYGVDLRKVTLDSIIGSKNVRLEYLFDAYQKLALGKEFFNNYFDYLVGSSKLKNDIIQGEDIEKIYSGWRIGLEEFEEIRSLYLIYDGDI